MRPQETDMPIHAYTPAILRSTRFTSHPVTIGKGKQHYHVNSQCFISHTTDNVTNYYRISWQWHNNIVQMATNVFRRFTVAVQIWKFWFTRVFKINELPSRHAKQPPNLWEHWHYTSRPCCSFASCQQKTGQTSTANFFILEWTRNAFRLLVNIIIITTSNSAMPSFKSINS